MLTAHLLLAVLAASTRISSVRGQDDARNGTASTAPFQSLDSSAIQLDFIVPPADPSALTPGHLLLAPRNTADDSFRNGPLIVDAGGSPIWDGAAAPYNFTQAMLFEAWRYLDQDVLLLWQGQFFAGGYGTGYGLVLNASYDVVANVSSTIEGTGLDFHEFRLTDQGTALILIYTAEPYDLSSYNVTTEDGDDSLGWILNNYVQEIDVATGEALFTWNALDHIDPTRGYADPGTTGGSSSSAWDFLHFNSIEKDSAGNYLVSSRHYHALFYVAGNSPAEGEETGQVLWQMGGEESSFQMLDGAAFSWQHDARWLDEGTRLSVLDNAASTWTVSGDRARGLILGVNTDDMTVSLEQEYLPYADEVSPSQAGIRQQPNGDMLAGWGNRPWISEYSADGTLIWAARMPEGVQSYRAERAEWTGTPRTDPSISVSTNTTVPLDEASGSGVDVDGDRDDTTHVVRIYLSWNGATDIDTWHLHTATSEDGAGREDDAVQVRKAGFETAYDLELGAERWGDADELWVWAEARGADGDVLGETRRVRVSRANDEVDGQFEVHDGRQPADVGLEAEEGNGDENAASQLTGEGMGGTFAAALVAGLGIMLLL